VPNADSTLFPGAFAEVALVGTRANPPLVVPSTAIVFRADGAQLAIVGADRIVHLQKVVVGRDYGDRVEILQGVEEGATVISVSADAAREGARVVPVDREAIKD